MRVLLTGASSFTGYWFARELARRGHEVCCTFREVRPSNYSGSRHSRVADLITRLNIQSVWGLSFGDDPMLDLVLHGQFEVVCLHGATVANYKAVDFDWRAAFEADTRRAVEFFRQLHAGGVRKVLTTGTFFEPGEGTGKGAAPTEAVSPYGLAKALSCQVLRYLARHCGIMHGRFVVGIPFGPGEDDEKFVSALVRGWLKNERPVLRTPNYVRDWVPVTVLAELYADLVQATWDPDALPWLRPSGAVETVQKFAERIGAQLGPLLGIDAEIESAPQTEFREPQYRANTDVIPACWERARAHDFWLHLATWYKKGALN